MAARVGTISLMCLLPGGWNCHERDPVSTRQKRPAPQRWPSYSAEGTGSLHDFTQQSQLLHDCVPLMSGLDSEEGNYLFRCCILGSLIQQLSLHLRNTMLFNQIKNKIIKKCMQHNPPSVMETIIPKKMIRLQCKHSGHATPKYAALA